MLLSVVRLHQAASATVGNKFPLRDLLRITVDVGGLEERSLT